MLSFSATDERPTPSIGASAAPRRLLASRLLRLVLATILLTLAGGALAIAPASPAAAATAAELEREFHAGLNATRASAGLAPLALDGGLMNIARSWSVSMANVYARTGEPVVKPYAPNDCNQSSLCHRPNLTQAVAAVEPNWWRIGENLGVGGSVGSIQNALWNSAPHRANILGDYNRVGIGVHVVRNRIWVTFDFLKGAGPAIPPPPLVATQVPAKPAANVAAIAANSRYNPVSPIRLADTRTGHGVPAGFIGTGGTLRLRLTGVSVPAGATGAVLNVTATETRGAGYLTAYPCGSSRPLASNLNVRGGDTRANMVAVALDGTGQVCIFTTTTTHLVVDLAGWYGSGGASYQATPPKRVLDSRTGLGRRTAFQLNLGGAVPAGSTAVSLNLTATNPVAGGYLTAYPCGTAAPLASNVNFAAGQTVANLAKVKLGAGGKVCLASNVPTDVVVDLAGSYGTSGSRYTSAVPARFLDTRDGSGGWLGQAGSLQKIELAVGGTRGIPANATAVAINLTVTGSSAGGYVVAYPCDQAMPTASNLNFRPGDTVANLAVVRLPANGKVCLTSNVNTHLVADVAGWYTS